MSRRLLVVVLALSLGTGSCAFGGIARDDDASGEPEVSITQNVAPPPESDVADVVEDVLPSVVNVRVTSLRDSVFGAQEVQGQGSGVIIDQAGIVLTNFHVVASAVNVKVVFTEDDREPVEGTVIGTAPERDLAVIQIPEDGLDPIEIGTSSKLRLGDSVIALGFPLGLGGPTVTRGILSGEERNISVPGDDGSDESLQDLLQTDAAINPGNSGGPLVDASGRLIGINTAAASAGAAENVGFAIAIDSALPIVREILSEPQEERAWLGVIIRTLDAPVAAELELDPDLEGALVTDTVGDGPADRAGIGPGDVIVRIGDADIASNEDVAEALADLDPGDEVEVEVVSPDERRTVSVTLAQRPAPPEE